jgi:hypothetical protein
MKRYVCERGTAHDVIYSNQYNLLHIYYALQFFVSQNICPLYVHPIHLREQVYLILSYHIGSLFLTLSVSYIPAYVADLLGYLIAQSLKLFALFSLWITATFGAQLQKESSHIMCWRKKMVVSWFSYTVLNSLRLALMKHFCDTLIFHRAWMFHQAYVVPYLIIFTLILWRIDPLLSGDSVNSDRF